jgi:type II secretory pathway pseudopilin PulG
MSRHYRRARTREGGFTFVELLVTILIAGIAFAAMVPVFVGAQEASSGDVVRNAALQLAQDKLEKIRGLDYDLIDQTALTNNTVPNNLFGTSVTWTTGGGGSRQFTVAYQVDYIGKDGAAGAAPGQESYKQVTVTASWTAPPAPVDPVVLSTMVSKQYAGPQILSVTLGPPYVLDTDPTTNKTSIIGGPLVIDVYIAPDDILSMNQSAAEEYRGYVEFTITPLNGTSVADQKVTEPVSSSEPGHYQFSWDNSSASNGVYIIQAVAVAGFGSRSQGMPWSLALDFVNNAPPPPTGLQALGYDGRVLLTWNTAATGSIDHYEVFRSTDGVAYTHLADTTSPDSYDDNAVTNGVTYYYKVKTVDSALLTGALSTEASATPTASADNVAPSVPAPLVATVDATQPTVHLTWTTSVDGGTPTSGLAGYIVERQKSGSSTWERLQTLYQGTVYDDTTAGWSTTWTYRVCAQDVAGNPSGFATAGPVTTVVLVLRQITVTNNSNVQAYVWVQNVASSQWYTTAGVASATQPAAVWVKKNGNSDTWASLPSGDYNVYFMDSTTFNLATNLLKTELVHTGSGNGTATYP